MEIFKIIIVGLITVVTSIILKQVKPEMALLVSIAGGLVIVFMVIQNVVDVFNTFNNLSEKTGINSGLFKSILKVVGIGYITEFASSVCVDSGNSSIADKIMFSGKVCILVLSMPVINNLIEMIIGLMPWKNLDKHLIKKLW